MKYDKKFAAKFLHHCVYMLIVWLLQDEVEKLYSQVSEQAKAKLQVHCVIQAFHSSWNLKLVLKYPEISRCVLKILKILQK